MNFSSGATGSASRSYVRHHAEFALAEPVVLNPGIESDHSTRPPLKIVSQIPNQNSHMEIVHYPHPALRFKSVDVQRIDGALRKTIRKMFDLMYDANGIGLAANQVGLPFRFFLVNLAARADQPDEELVFINPKIRKRKGSVSGEEGCLSLPGLFGDVTRFEEVVIEAFDLSGQPFEMELSELPARVVQHEADHLDGVIFPDRMREEEASDEVELLLPKFTENFRRAQKEQLFANDEELQQKLEKMAKTGAVPADFVDTPVHKLPAPKLEDE